MILNSSKVFNSIFRGKMDQILLEHGLLKETGEIEYQWKKMVSHIKRQEPYDIPQKQSGMLITQII